MGIQQSPFTVQIELLLACCCGIINKEWWSGEFGSWFEECVCIMYACVCVYE